MAAESPIALIYGYNGSTYIETSIRSGIAVPSGQPGFIALGSDGTNTRYLKTDSSGNLRIDPTGTTAQPVTDNGGSLTVDGTVGATQSGTWTVQPGNTANTTPWLTSIAQGGNTATVTGANALKVDGSAVTQPISAASLPLPSGAATEATLATLLTLAGFQARINSLGQKTMANSTPVVLASDQSVIPISDNSGSLTVDTPQLPSSLVSGRLDVNIGASTTIAVSQSGTWTVAQGTAAALSGAWPVKVTDGTNTLPTMDAVGRAGFVKVTDGTNTQPTGDAAARAIFHKVTDGTNTAAVKAASTAAVATDPALVVAISPNNTLPISIASGSYGGQVEGRAASGASAVGNPVYVAGIDGSTARGIAVDSSGRIITAPAGSSASVSGFTFGALPTSSGSLQKVEATAYTEQSSNAQRSLVSSSANDSSAGTGARTVKITYLKSDGTGPFTDTVTMNGTTAVNTTATDICFIEKMEVVTVGSNGTNVGKISLKASTGGGGATIGSIGVSTLSTGGDGRTLWAHHYIPSGKTMHVTSALTGHGGNTSQGSGGVFHLKSAPIGVSNAIEIQITDFIHQYGQASSTQRFYDTPIDIAGPARITAYVQPDAALTVVYLFSWDYYED